MPLEIRELVIKLTVENDGPKPTPAAPDRESLVAECVDQVLEILKDKEER